MTDTLPQIALGDIIFKDEDRIREDLGEKEIDELATSLAGIGQLHPIILERNNALVAGRRRIEAARKLGWTTIGFRYFDDLDTLSSRIIEYEENSRRKQLTWQEEARALKEIHDLKRLASPGRWDARDTASMLGVSEAKVSEHLTLANSLNNPTIVNRPTVKGALLTARRVRELELARELAVRKTRRTDHVLEQTTHPSKTFGNGTLYHADCLDVLAKLQDESVDLIVTDPPWGINFDRSTQWTFRYFGSYNDRPDEVITLLPKAFAEMGRVLKESGHLYIFHPIQFLEWWAERLTEAGFSVRPRPLIWFKIGQPSISDIFTSFLPAYESIMWAFRSKRNEAARFFSSPTPDAFAFPRQAGLWHENEKPIELLVRLIETSSNAGEIVLDPFSGGASTLVAAYQTGRFFIGIEKDIVNYGKACDRLTKLEENMLVEDTDV